MSGALSFSPAHLAGLAATALAIVSVTASFAFAKRELQDSSPLFSAGFQLGVAAVVLGVVSVVIERGQASQWTSSSLVSLGLLSVAGSAVALPLFYWLLRECEPGQVATVEWMQPLISVAEGAALLHQRVPGTFYLGSLGVIACTVVLAVPREQEESLSLSATTGQNEP
jgi:drug/metabolite transporter (DMT)-like permease